MTERLVFEYDKSYFDKHFGSAFYRWYVDIIRNRSIKRQITKYVKSGRLLEIGFGDDNLLMNFNHDFELYGVDISEFAVNNLPKKYKAENFKLCDISKEKIPFNCQFDVIVTINTVEHLVNPRFALMNIYEKLKPEGIFIVSLPTRSNIFSKIQYKFLYDVPEHIYRPSVTSLSKVFSETGFKKLTELAASFFPFRLSNRMFLESLNLYFGVFQKNCR